MNYIRLINAYWYAHEFHDLKGIDAAVYLWLLSRFNHYGIGTEWPPVLKIRNKILMDAMHLRDLRTLQASRLSLKKAELIYFEQIPGSPYCAYKLL